MNRYRLHAPRPSLKYLPGGYFKGQIVGHPDNTVQIIDVYLNNETYVVIGEKNFSMSLHLFRKLYE